MTDWSLPFAERYTVVKRALKEIPEAIERDRQEIEVIRNRIDRRLHEFKDAEIAMRHMQTYDADQIAAYEAHGEAVRENLRKAGWKV